MKILICNDDGYLAPGIQALAKAMSELGEVTVFAPEGNRSGSSSALTLDKPLTVTKVADHHYYVNGTPADCVHIALTSGLIERPDLVVSGINQGQNLSDDTIYSGTVAAAIEGYMFGVSAIAFSQVQRGWAELDAAAKMAKQIVEKCCQAHNKPFLLNVNIPNVAFDELKAPVVTTLGKRHTSLPVIAQPNRDGESVYWIGPFGEPKDMAEGSDFYAVKHGHVSVTPLQVDLTHGTQLDAFRKILHE